MASENDTVEKLELCPFCGGECSLGQDNGDHLGNREYWIDCDEQGCYYRSGNAQSASEAIATHNRVARANARIANVVKECEKRIKYYGCGKCTFVDEPPWTFEQCDAKGCPTRRHAMEFLSILRAARGEVDAVSDAAREPCGERRKEKGEMK